MRRHLALLGLVLALLGVGRLGLTVFHEPFLGYGDQADMVRVGACIGMYPDIPKADRPKTTYWAPVPKYVFDERLPDQCIFGSELPIAWLAVGAFRAFSDASLMDLRWVGGTKIALSLLLVAAGVVLLWPFPLAALLHGATVLLLVGDPVLGLWFNTLYAEMPIVLGAYALIVALVAVALRGAGGPLAVALVFAGSFLLGVSKIQFFLLPLALVVLSLPMSWRADRRFAGLALAAAVVPVVVFLWPGKIGAMAPNRVDTYLGALPSSSKDPLRTLQRLGLPARCAPMVGGTWFRPRGEKIDELCPEVFKLGNAAFLKLLVDEPGTLAVALARSLAPSQNAFSGYLGFVAGSRHGRFESVAPWARSAWEPLFMELRARHYVALVAFAGCAGLLAAFAYLGLAVRHAWTRGFAFAFYLTLLAACFAYTLATSVLGDGFADMAKHALLGSMALAAALVAALGWSMLAWTPALGGAARAATVAVIGLSAAGAFLLMGEYRKLALAHGVIDRPGDTRLDGGAVELFGWAWDPYGVDSIHARVGTHRYFGRYGLDRGDVHRVFPTLPRAASSGFTIQVPAGAISPAAPDVVVYATNRLGVETEIDRRRLAGVP